MYITKLKIFAFGKHDNITIPLTPGVNILYGENEAGKTTVQQFILHILFGFPPRNSTLLRYEPKSTRTYGGQVHLYDKRFGHVIVERTEGRSSGDVTVYFDNDTTGDEEALGELLQQYDRSAFEAIYSFSLLQLQGFEKMDEQTLSRTLFASGTTGLDELLKIEEKMQKSADTKYKKYGKKPILNQQLQKLKVLEQEKQEVQLKLAQYEPTIERIAKLNTEISTLHVQQEKTAEQIEQLSLQQQLRPMYMKKKELEAKTNHISNKDFPAKGIARLESLMYQLNEAKAIAKTIQTELQQEGPNFKISTSMDEIKELEQLLEYETEWHQQLSLIIQYRQELLQLKGKVAQVLSRLGIQSLEEGAVFAEADVSIEREEEMYTLLEQQQSCQRELDEVEKTLQQLHEKMIYMQERWDMFERPTEEEIQSVKEWPMDQQRLAEARAYVALQTTQTTQTKMTQKLFVSGLIILLIVSLWSKIWLLSVTSIVLIGVTFYMMRSVGKHSKETEMKQRIMELEQVEQKMATIMEKVQQYEVAEKEYAEEHIELEQAVDAKKHQQTALRNELHYVGEQLNTFLSTYHIYHTPSTHLIPELFRLIREVQELMREEYQRKEQLSQLLKKVEMWQQRVQSILDIDIPRERLYERVRSRYQQLIQQREQHLAYEQKKEEQLQRVREIDTLIERFNTQIQQLYKEANVHTEEAFYQAYEENETYQKLQEQIAQIESQLLVHDLSVIDWTLSMTQIEETLKEAKSKHTHFESQRHQLFEEKAELTHQVSQLMSDQTYSDLLQTIEIEKATLVEMTKEWATEKAISVAIMQMMNELKEKRFPKVLERAENYFKQLTNLNYTSLHITDRGLFEVSRSDGLRFPIIELSQATKEQAYISLRFALADTLQENMAFPMIMDDPFVHFDETRLKNMIKLIEESSNEQFIYFTCHKTLQQHWQDANLINVAEIGYEEGMKIT